MVLTDKKNILGFCYSNVLDSLEWLDGLLLYNGKIYKLLQFEIQGDFAIMELKRIRINRK